MSSSLFGTEIPYAKQEHADPQDVLRNVSFADDYQIPFDKIMQMEVKSDDTTQLLSSNGATDFASVKYKSHTRSDSSDYDDSSDEGGAHHTLENENRHHFNRRNDKGLGMNGGVSSATTTSGELQPEVKGMIVVLRYLGIPTRQVVEEVRELGFDVCDSNVIMIWDDWVSNRESHGIGKKKKIRYSGDQRKSGGDVSQLDGFQSDFGGRYMTEEERKHHEEQQQIDEELHDQDILQSGLFAGQKSTKNTNHTNHDDSDGQYSPGSESNDSERSYDAGRKRQSNAFSSNDVRNVVTSSRAFEKIQNPMKHRGGTPWKGQQQDEDNSSGLGTSSNSMREHTKKKAMKAIEEFSEHVMIYNPTKGQCRGCGRIGKRNKVFTGCRECQPNGKRENFLCPGCYKMIHTISEDDVQLQQKYKDLSVVFKKRLAGGGGGNGGRMSKEESMINKDRSERINRNSYEEKYSKPNDRGCDNEIYQEELNSSQEDILFQKRVSSEEKQSRYDVQVEQQESQSQFGRQAAASAAAATNSTTINTALANAGDGVKEVVKNSINNHVQRKGRTFNRLLERYELGNDVSKGSSRTQDSDSESALSKDQTDLKTGVIKQEQSQPEQPRMKRIVRGLKPINN